MTSSAEIISAFQVFLLTYVLTWGVLTTVQDRHQQLQLQTAPLLCMVEARCCCFFFTWNAALHHRCVVRAVLWMSEDLWSCYRLQSARGQARPSDVAVHDKHDRCLHTINHVDWQATACLNCFSILYALNRFTGPQPSLSCGRIFNLCTITKCIQHYVGYVEA